VIYPGPFGSITAGADKDYPLDYSHLNIQGDACGAKGLPKGVVAGPDTATFPSVNTATEYVLNKHGLDAIEYSRHVNRRRDPRRGSGKASAPS
jgi:hypothetical protein